MTTPATSASAVALPFKPAEDPGLPSGPQWGLALVLCAMAVGWKRQGGLLDVVESRALGPQAQLHIVRYGGRQLLLSVGPTGTQCLRDDPIDAGATP
jgi:hypothetical protein